MLTIEPALTPSAGTGKLGLALAGGGPLGAFYELGALHAIGEALVGRELTDFDVYVGVSSGSLVAAGLANGFDTTSLGTTFILDTGTLVPFAPELMLQPAIGMYAERLAKLPQALTAALRQYARSPLNGAWPPLLRSLLRLAPTAIFDNEPLQRYLHDLFSTAGHTDDFRKLRKQLYVVATRLTTGESVAFGDARHNQVPISKAVMASAALPGLYAGVEIGGHHYVDGALLRTMHASLALEHGCDLVICVNPLVPFDSSQAQGRRYRNLVDEGLPTILSQTFRAMIHSRMQVGMARYRGRYPGSDTLLFEPDRHDETFFFTNVFRYSGRRKLVEHAYQKTRRDLLANAPELGRLLRRRNLDLDLDILRNRRRTFETAARARTRRARQVVKRLQNALGRLDRLIPPDLRT
jgi:predicted acylesterase/phospholipase RssA